MARHRFPTTRLTSLLAVPFMGAAAIGYWSGSGFDWPMQHAAASTTVSSTTTEERPASANAGKPEPAASVGQPEPAADPDTVPGQSDDNPDQVEVLPATAEPTQPADVDAAQADADQRLGIAVGLIQGAEIVRTAPKVPTWEPERGNVVYLTYDDGPDPQWTPQILDLLKAHNAKATFYALGHKVAEQPELARRIVAEGHSLQNHSWDHSDFTKLSYDQVLAQVQGTNRAITETTGTWPKCVRTPFGHVNDTTRAAIREAGLLRQHWDANSMDFTEPGVEKILSNVMSGLRPGANVLFHDGGGVNRTQTIAATKILLEKMSAQGTELKGTCT